MKTTLLFFSLLFANILANANTPFTITLVNGEDVTNGAFTVFGVPTQETFETDAFIKNNKDTAAKIRVRRRNISVNPQTENYFCWFQCYGPAVDVDPTNNFIMIGANETNYESFHSYFKPQGVSSINTIRYTFFDNNPGHTSDSAFVDITYNVQLPIEPILIQIPNSGFITNSNVTVNSQIDTTNFQNLDMVYPLTIINNTNIIKQIVIKKREISVVEGSQNFFSWRSTFNPTVMVDTGGFVMYPNTTISDEFKAVYRPNGNLGSSTIQYVVYNKFDINDSSYINVNFNVVYNAVNDVKKQNIKLQLAPNPTSNFATLYFDKINSENSNLSIVNLIGEEVANYAVSNNQTQQKIDVQNLNNGVYFCRLITKSNNISTIKLVVAK